MKKDDIRDWDEDIEDDDSKEIDLMQMAKQLWARRKTIFIWCGIGAVLGLIIAFSIPKEYTTTVKLAPELSDNKNSASGSLGALAAMAGMSTANANGADAVYPNLYPDVLQSVPFCVSLFDVPVPYEDGKTIPLKEYLEEDTKSPWWGVVMGVPGKIIGAIMPKKEEYTGNGQGTDPFHLTKDEMDLVTAIQERVTGSVDTKTFVVTINVEMQDPMIAAVLADTVMNRLREYVTNYRTNKARQNMEYAEQMNQEAQDAYYKAQQKLANYLDTNQGIALYSARTTRERLENEATLAFNLYNQTSQRLQSAKAKVQEVTPVYATIEPPTVPVKPSAPRKVMILAGFIFLAFVAAAAWILFIKPTQTDAEAAVKAADAKGALPSPEKGALPSSDKTEK